MTQVVLDLFAARQINYPCDDADLSDLDGNGVA
jgi:hypothetical protein